MRAVVSGQWSVISYRTYAVAVQGGIWGREGGWGDTPHAPRQRRAKAHRYAGSSPLKGAPLQPALAGLFSQ